MSAVVQEWLVDQCVCGHHITAHAKGKDACRYHPGDCTAYRWDEVGIRRVPARPAEPTGELREQIARALYERDDAAEFTTWAQLPDWNRRMWLSDADALLSGPLAPLLAKLRAVEALADQLMTERSLVPDIARRAAAERIHRALDAS